MENNKTILCGRKGIAHTVNRQTIVRVLLWATVIGMMTVIFAFSAQPGPDSDELSNLAAEPLVELVSSLGDGVDAADMQLLHLVISTIIRKLAHFAEYALLGLLLRLLCLQYDRGQIWLPVLVGVLWAASDEFHQTFVPGRTGMVTDVLLDGAGVCCGVYAQRYICKIRRK